MSDVGRWLGPIFNCGLPLLLLALGLFAGRSIERRHLRRLRRTEAGFADMPVSDRSALPGGRRAGGAILVTGSAVVASDYLKTFLAGFRNVFGGEVRSFTTLMERARREALCRMLADARRVDAIAVVNVRLETSSIGAMRRKRPSPMVEVLAYGTAVLGPGAPPAALEVALPCPRCGYALVGMDELGCPECGWNRGSAG